MPGRKKAHAMQSSVSFSSLPPTVGILLAGGRAMRMGGSDKSLTKLGGISLLARITAILRPQCDSLLINANGAHTRFAEFNLPVVADDVEGFAGPLAGILAGLDYVAAHQPKAAFALSVPTDTPFLPTDLVERLHATRSAGVDITCARSDGAIHPVVALWPIKVREALRRALVQEDLRKVTGFMARYNVAYADWPASPFDPFFNINRPDDLAKAEAILKMYRDRPGPGAQAY